MLAGFAPTAEMYTALLHGRSLIHSSSLELSSSFLHAATARNADVFTARKLIKQMDELGMRTTTSCPCYSLIAACALMPDIKKTTLTYAHYLNSIAHSQLHQVRGRLALAPCPSVRSSSPSLGRQEPQGQGAQPRAAFHGAFFCIPCLLYVLMHAHVRSPSARRQGVRRGSDHCGSQSDAAQHVHRHEGARAQAQHKYANSVCAVRPNTSRGGVQLPSWRKRCSRSTSSRLITTPSRFSLSQQLPSFSS
jgi:hypothetical protein